MELNEKPRFFGMLAEVMAYHRQDTSEFMLNVFWDACKELPFEQAVAAFNAHAKDPESGKFAPKVADIVRLLHGTKTDRAMVAWGKVYDAMSSVGAYTDVCFDEPAINAAVNDCGGWPKMCRTNTEELSYLQHQFTKSYTAYAGRTDFDYPKVLTGDGGSAELYAKRGLQAPKPRMIGNQQAALAVNAGGVQLLTGGFKQIQAVAREALNERSA